MIPVNMKHWIFDFDGTLVDSEGYFTEAFRYVLAPFSISVDRDFIEQVRHKHPHKIFEDYLTEEQSHRAFERMAEIGGAICDKVELFPGVIEIIELLEKRGESLSIWTGRDANSTLAILRKQGIESLFETIVTGTCVENNKPSLEGLQKIQKRFQAQAEDMVMIGDHPHDIEPANRLGCFAVHAQWKQNPIVLPGPLKAGAQFSTTKDFLDWLRKSLLTKG